MSIKPSDLEERILRDIKAGAVVPLERSLLALSGLKIEEEIRSYQLKIDDIFGRFVKKRLDDGFSRYSKPPPYLHCSVAKRLFEYLWVSKPKRFGDHFLLTDVIDAQLDPDVDRFVGTCVGLTSLYSVLGLRAGLNLSVLVDSDHLLNRLRVAEESIDIDHTDPQGFHCTDREDFSEFPLLTLTANVLNSRGLAKERRGQFSAAGEDYEKALLINPHYANAFNNRGNMRFMTEDVAGAIEDYSEAIRLNRSFCEAYCNRGMALQRLGLQEEARRDYIRALNINSEYGDAHKCLSSLDRTGQPSPRSSR